MNIYHEKQISNIAYEISEKVLNGKIKWIGIAGPSAKTTFTKKLGLKSKGIETVVISMDDYYKNTNDATKNKKGNLDFECLDELMLLIKN